MAKLIELHIRSIGPNNVPNPFRDGWIGRTYDVAAEEFSAGGVEDIRCTLLDMAIHAKYLRDAIIEGELACEDAATAAALGLPFIPVKTLKLAKEVA